MLCYLPHSHNSVHISGPLWIYLEIKMQRSPITIANLLVLLLAVMVVLLPQQVYASCGCQYAHACFPPDGNLLKQAADQFMAGTWGGTIGGFDYGLNISQWCTGNVLTMANLFKMVSSSIAPFNADIGEWNTASVTLMNGMFISQILFNQDIGGWDVSSVTDMRLMFQDATSFNGDIRGWDVSSVQDFSQTLYGATSFNQDIGGWNVSSVETMYSMFADAISFNQDIGGWNVSSTTRMDYMFYNATSFNQDISGWYMYIDNETRLDKMFYGASAFNQNLCAWKENFPYSSTSDIFSGSDCTFTTDPQLATKGPFCSDDCAPSQQPSTEPSYEPSFYPSLKPSYDTSSKPSSSLTPSSTQSSSKSAKSKALKANAIITNLQVQEMKSGGSSLSLVSRFPLIVVGIGITIMVVLA